MLIDQELTLLEVVQVGIAMKRSTVVNFPHFPLCWHVALATSICWCKQGDHDKLVETNQAQQASNAQQSHSKSIPCDTIP